MERVLLNPLSLCKVKSNRDWENLHLITVSSVWEQEDVVIKGADCSARFLFSYRGVNWRTKRGNIKSLTAWSLGLHLKLWGKSLTSRRSVLQFSSLTGLMSRVSLPTLLWCPLSKTSRYNCCRDINLYTDVFSKGKLLHIWKGKKYTWQSNNSNY